ncbi:helix-turn-helix domain-containing protein [Actinosynnema sp. NPDC047251]|uniref:winged helix-turn-helix transcriptional regulator n=1 Tax=Saccharothrix espanaensis TaxID=103731 RepID=UPI0002F5D7B9|nr:helix-turn-helix domain-containing protein [Saccharothrix espanaensis]
MGDKWVGLILVALADGARRYSELHRTITGVSQKMPARTLRSLGRSLLPVMAAIKPWAETNIEQVVAHREHYDSR